MSYKPGMKITDKYELAEHIWAIDAHYQKNGFPHFSMTETERLVAFSNFQRLDRASLFDDNTIKQAQHGLGLAWSYFPHHWEVKCNRNLTVFEAWQDDKKRRQAIEKALRSGRYEIYDGKPFLNEAKMRAAISYVSGVQRVSNFRPSAAALIYDIYGGKRVWDMSCGYGGRLLGAIASNQVSEYIGTDPSFKTFIGLQLMKDDLAHLTKTNVYLHNVGSEDYIPESEEFDLCFTSPPYFDTEKYDDNENQSYRKFPSVDSWNNGFLRVTLENAYRGLKTGKRLILNVANTKSHDSLETEAVSIAEDIGFRLHTTLKMSLSSKGGGIKFEPIFVFVK